MKKKNGNIIKYRKPLKINIGMIVFGIILLYLIFNIYFYLSKNSVSVYEVQQGTIAANHTYRGLILRSEEIVKSDGEGYVNYFLKDASKAGVKTPVYSLDSTGKISQQFESAGDAANYSEEDYAEIENTVSAYTGSYDEQNFYSVYSFKDEINAKMMELLNSNVLKSLEGQTGLGSFQVHMAEKPGVVVYYTDGYEGITTENITDASFDENKYKKLNLKEQKTVGAGVPVYKLITDENWNVIFQISEELEKTLENDDTIKVLFKDDGNTIWAYYDLLRIGGDWYLNLKLRTSMIRFANQRFIDVELLLDDAKGLKIPNSAITTKKFFIVPKEYFIRGKDSYGLLLAGTGEGEKDSYITPEIFYEKDGFYYIDDKAVTSGAIVKKQDSNETYQIQKTEKLKGVYNINKGYAVFKQIDVLYQNEEYSILKTGTDYGISLYDHIALDGNSVKEDELVY